MSSNVYWRLAYIKDTIYSNIINPPLQPPSLLSQSKIAPANLYKFTNCGGPSDMATFKSFSVSPDPISPPCKLNISFEFDVHQPVEGSLDLNLTIGVKVLGTWYELPCVASFLGSCNYNDICPYLDYTFERCPLSFIEHGIPCKCPLNVGNYQLPPTSVFLPEGFNSGEYLVKLVLSHKQRPVACGQVEFSFA